MSMLKRENPVFYTSADSVFQIACHEESFGLQKLYDLCAIARELVDEYHIARVIARPLWGLEAVTMNAQGIAMIIRLCHLNPPYWIK